MLIKKLGPEMIKLLRSLVEKMQLNMEIKRNNKQDEKDLSDAIKDKDRANAASKISSITKRRR
jgi:hypothetical protein